MPSNKSIRKRKLSKGFTASATVEEADPPFTTWKPLSKSGYLLDGIQVTESEGHPWPPRISGAKGDVGGPFRTQKTECLIIGHPVTFYTESAFGRRQKWFSYVLPGGLPSLPPLLQSTKSVGPSDNELNIKGAEAVSICSPTNSIADAATFLAEIHREGLPSLPGASLWKSSIGDFIHNVGSEFLNYEFGLSPTVDEIKNFVDTVGKASKVLEQYRRDSGKTVRRQFSFPLDASVESTVIKPSVRALASNATGSSSQMNSGPSGSTVRQRNTSRNISFSGAFTYHLPDKDDFFGRLLSIATESDKVFGTNITPETLWELTPWSWAIDWFSDAQQVIENLQNMELYGLVMRYGYLMCETITRDIYFTEEHSGITTSEFIQGQKFPTLRELPLSDVSQVVITTTEKRRIRANPFGFGLEWADLSPTQLAIAAALGITRVL